MDTTGLLIPKLERKDNHIKSNLAITPEDYMQDRVVYKIKNYDRVGEQQKWLYLGTSLAGIILAASVPVFINIGVSQIVPTVLSLIVTILVSIEKLFHFRERWRNYEEIAAFLRSEQVKFQTSTGEYAKKDGDSDKTFQHFVMRIEQAISSERVDTIELRTREDSNKDS